MKRSMITNKKNRLAWVVFFVLGFWFYPRISPQQPEKNVAAKPLAAGVCLLTLSSHQDGSRCESVRSEKNVASNPTAPPSDTKRIKDPWFQLCHAAAPFHQVQQAVGQTSVPHKRYLNSAITHSARRRYNPTNYDSFGCYLPFNQCNAQGEYIGPPRTPHLPEYRVRNGDLLAFVFRLTRKELDHPYELQVGDEIRVESETIGKLSSSGTAPSENSSDTTITRELIIQPDGTITLPLIGQIPATRRSIRSLTAEIEKKYTKFYKLPAITVTAIKVNTKLADLLDAVDARFGNGGRQFQVRISPAGTLSLPAIGSVYVQGLSLGEIKAEVDARLHTVVPGIEVTPIVTEQAPHFVYVLGEVAQPGQFQITTPTTAMQAIALAGSWNIGANTRQIVIFRRDDNWNLTATMLDLRSTLYANNKKPFQDLFLRDSDIILVPKSKIQVVDEFIEQFFTKGVYSAVPQDFLFDINLGSSSSIP